jgi:hypothetical protein
MEMSPHMVDFWSEQNPKLWFTQKNNSGADEHPFSGHHPYARPLQTGWTQDAAGHWESSGADVHSWEVICEECGDTDGPAETQSEEVRGRRGPYSSKHKAEHAATKHFDGDQ